MLLASSRRDQHPIACVKQAHHLYVLSKLLEHDCGVNSLSAPSITTFSGRFVPPVTSLSKYNVLSIVGFHIRI